MFFPIRDINPSRTAPIVTKSIIAINVLVYIYSVLFYNHQLFVLKYSFIPAQIFGIELPSKLQLLRKGTGTLSSMFYSMFIHGDFWHILGNMWFLWIFGDNVEDVLGKVRFTFFYIISGLGATITHSIVNAILSPHSLIIPTIGASGAISGVLGAYLVLFPGAIVEAIFIIFPVFLPAFIFIGMWFLMQVLYSFSGVPGVAWWAHIGGFLIGFFWTKNLVNKGTIRKRYFYGRMY